MRLLVAIPPPSPSTKKLPLIKSLTDNVKAELSNCIALSFPSPDEDLVLLTAASIHSLAAVLCNVSPAGDFRVLDLWSRRIPAAQCGYSIFRKEMLAVLGAVSHWHRILVPGQFTIFSCAISR